jgi:AAA domain
MLERLFLRGIGPAATLGPVEFGERVNLITGDNGVGKTFLLDTAWWALTGSWPRVAAWPRPDSGPGNPPVIKAQVRGGARTVPIVGRYQFDREAWNAIASVDGKPICRGLIEDWVTWQQTSSDEWEALCAALAKQSPPGNERLVPGKPAQVWLDDVRLHPTLALP